MKRASICVCGHPYFLHVYHADETMYDSLTQSIIVKKDGFKKGEQSKYGHYYKLIENLPNHDRRNKYLICNCKEFDESLESYIKKEQKRSKRLKWEDEQREWHLLNKLKK
jgi:hypothetical protein